MSENNIPTAEVVENENKYVVEMRYWLKSTLTVIRFEWDKKPFPSQLVGKIAQHLYKTASKANVSKLDIALMFPESYYGLKETGIFTVKNLKVLQTCLPALTEQLITIFGNEQLYDDSYEALEAGGINQFQDEMMARIGSTELAGTVTASKVDAIKEWGKCLHMAQAINKPKVLAFANAWRAKLNLPSVEEQKQLEKIMRENKKLLEAAAPAAE